MIKTPLILTLFAFLFTLSAAVESHAQSNSAKNKGTEWEYHESITGVFETKFPQKYKYKIFPFQFNQDTVAFSAEIASTLDGATGTKEKSILIKSVQTFGTELAGITAKKALQRAADRYVRSAESIGGAVITNENIKFNGFLGKNIYISYSDKGEKIGLRIMIYMTNYAKVELVLTGPANTMYSYRSDDFFNSVKLFDGVTKLSKEDQQKGLGFGWDEHISPNSVFTVRLPPKSSDYTPEAPRFHATPSQEKMSFVIVDPVINENVFYNVASYVGKNSYKRESALKALFANHVSRFIENAKMSDLNVEQFEEDDGTQVIRTKIIITPKRSLPYINAIFFEIRYKGNTMVIQEFLCGPKHNPSRIHHTMFSQLKFHPEKYKPIQPKAKKIPEEKEEESTESQ
ncbi:MAG: hypothetical protein ACRBDL_04985 [Alphaproteobacteria bacterium]